MLRGIILTLTFLILPFICTGSYNRRSENFFFSSYYHDYMVLQRNIDGTAIWGHSTKPTDTVFIKVNNVTVSFATVDDNQKWVAKFPSWQYTNGSCSISAHSSLGEIRIQDVLFGDVWICSGQSNMEYNVTALQNATEQLKDSMDFQQIRLFQLNHSDLTVPRNDVQGIITDWSGPSTDTLGRFSAVCWLYGKYLYQHLRYPIGLVDTSWGGTPIEAWSSPEALKSCGSTRRKRDQSQSSHLYNGMIYPLLSNTIKGAIWYHGEGDSSDPDPTDPEKYSCQFTAMINDWREKFYASSIETSNVNFPFGFVQLAPSAQKEVAHTFPDIRWAQTANFGYVPNPTLKDVFMAVATDLPDLPLPSYRINFFICIKFKDDVAQRLVLSALAVAYHQKGVEYQGPFPSSYAYDVNHHTLSIEFDNGKTPIEVRNETGFEVCCSSNNYICHDDDTRWMKANITTYSTSGIILDTGSCGSSHTIGGVRYAWRQSPCLYKKCSIYGRDTNLPAPPFKYLANI